MYLKIFRIRYEVSELDLRTEYKFRSFRINSGVFSLGGQSDVLELDIKV